MCCLTTIFLVLISRIAIMVWWLTDPSALRPCILELEPAGQLCHPGEIIDKGENHEKQSWIRGLTIGKRYCVVTMKATKQNDHLPTSINALSG